MGGEVVFNRLLVDGDVRQSGIKCESQSSPPQPRGPEDDAEASSRRSGGRGLDGVRHTTRFLIVFSKFRVMRQGDLLEGASILIFIRGNRSPTYAAISFDRPQAGCEYP